MAKLHEVTISRSPDGYVHRYQLNCVCNWHGQDNNLEQARADAQRHQQANGVDPADSEVNLPSEIDETAPRSRYEAVPPPASVFGETPAPSSIDINTMEATVPTAASPAVPEVANNSVLQKGK
jgi:hypothetical protein